MKSTLRLLAAILLLWTPYASRGEGEIVAPTDKGKVYEGPTCDQDTVSELINLVGEVSCLVSFDADCRMLLLRSLGIFPTTGFLMSPALDKAEVSAAKKVAQNFDKLRDGIKAVDPKAAKSLGTGKKFAELDKAGRAKILARLEKMAALGEKAAASGVKRAIVTEAIVAGARKGVSWLAWGATGVGLAITVGDVMYQAIGLTPAGDCEDDNMMGTFEGVKYTDCTMDGGQSVYSYAPGPHVRDFLKLPGLKQVAALRKNPELCVYYTEMIARLKEDKANLLKQMGEMNFTEAPQCKPNGRGVSFTIHELEKDVTYSSDENADGATTAFHVKSSNQADPDQFNFQMQTQDGVSTFATVEVQTVMRQTSKLTEAELSQLLPLHPEFTRVYQHFRRLQYWAPAMSACCREKDSKTCFQDLGLKTPAVPPAKADSGTSLKPAGSAKAPGTP